ncbi:MAG: glycoside hydrolase family 16 [Verrucomicrobiales bacterium]|nr:glycoside hydrolase family 16 [Verrucomicrobiales bacterium]
MKSLIALLTALLGAGAPLAAQSHAAPRPTPTLPGKWKLIPEFSDEFHLPALDQVKWQPGNPEWPGRPPGLYQEKNVVIEDGKLHLHLKAETLVNAPEGYKDYSCAVIRSRSRIRYGYFEIRAQAADSVGTSAFWFYHNEPTRWVEIDVFELAPRHSKFGRTLFTNAPVIRFPGQSGELTNKGEFPLREDPSAAFHTWGLLWDADLITWYLDGKPLRSLANTHWKNPLRLILDTETHPDWMGLPDPAKLPAVFIVDYVRTWQNDPS